MELQLLGPAEAHHGGATLALGAPRQRALLALLALNAGRAVSTSAIIDGLWGEAVPDSAPKMVQIGVSQLRKVLPPDVLVTRAPGYLLDLARERIDAFRAEDLLRTGRDALAAGDAEAAAAAFDEALALWRGPALAEFAEPFAAPEARRLEELQLSLREERIEAGLALGRHAELIGDIEALIARQPLRERPRGQLMLALYRCDRQAEALAAYQEARRVLSDELGIDPSPALRELERRILRQDHTLAPAPPPRPAAPAVPPAPQGGAIVGREEDLAALEGRLAAAAEGEMQVVIVTGEAGAGKTTLVEAFLAGAGAREDALIGRGQCVEHHGASEAYMPVLEALGGLCAAPGGEGLVPLLVERAPTWVAQMPWLLTPEELSRVQGRIVGATQERMLREIVEALLAAAADRLVVLALEDLHWSDPSTVTLLAALARRREAGRLLLVATLRSADAATRGHPVHAAVAELVPRGLCARLEVGALDEPAVEDYIRARVPGAALPEGVGRALRDRTSGNPLFLEQAVDAWIDDGKVVRDDGGWRLVARGDELARDVPSSVRQLIRRRLLTVGPEDRAILEAASVAAPEFSAALVAATCDRTVEEVEARCDALAREGIMLEARDAESWPDGTIAGRFGFTHDLCHEVLYEDLPAGRRARLHVAAGMTLEAAHGARAGDIAPALAAHFVRGGDARRALPHLIAAARQTSERLAPLEAIELCETGLRLLDRLPEGAERATWELDLLGQAGAARIATEGWGSAEAERTFERCRDLADELGRPDDASWSRYQLATLYEVRGDYPDSEAIMEEMLAAPAPSAGGPAAVDSHELLACSLLHQGVFDRALDLAERGAQASGDAPDNRLVAAYGDDPAIACHSWAALAKWHLGHPDAAARRAARSVALARDGRHAHAIAKALVYAAAVARSRRDLEGTLSLAAEGIDAARARGFRYWTAMGMILRGSARAAGGAPAEGVEEMRSGIDLARSTGARMDDAYFLGLLADGLIAAGEPGEALDALREALGAVSRRGRFFYDAELHRLRAEALRALGDDEEAEAALRCALAVARDQGGRSLELRAALSLGRLLRDTGRPKEAQAVVAAAYGGFEEGFDTPDLAEAAAFLAGGPGPEAPAVPGPAAEVRYASSGGLSIAYEVTGDGPVDIVLVPGFLSHLEMDRREPRHAAFLDRLARIGRLIRFDKRGTGMSDRPPDVPDLETRMDDVRAVMEAAGSERAVLFGYSEGGPMSVLFAATFPERVRGLVLYGAFAKRLDPDEDYPWAPTRQERARHLEMTAGDWRFEAQMRSMCPSADEAMARWWGERCRAAASPGAVRGLIEMNSRIDVRAVLPAIHAPTLVLHRGADARVLVEESRYLAERIPGARLVELPGADHFVAIDPDQILDAVAPFVAELAAAPAPPEPSRALATVVAADGRGAAPASVFDGPARAIRAGLEVARRLGPDGRVGVHTGEIDRRGGPSGPAVDLARAAAAAAAPGEVLVTATTRDLVPGSGLVFEDRGERRLGGDVTRRLFAVREGDQASEPAVLAAARAPATAAFVGRDDEMARLERALDAALRGSGGLAVISGDPGIGKSRTAAELAERARARGATVLAGRCYEREGAPPYWPWVQVLRALAGEADREALRRWAGAGAPEIAALVPELGERLGVPGEPVAGGGDPDQARFRMLDAVACALAAAAAERPLVVVLEDLHAADPGTLRLLELVARELAERPALVVATYRDGEVPRGHPLAETLAELSRERMPERVALGGLSRAEVERFISAAAGRPAPAALVDACVAQTEGNPLFLTELVRLLLQEGGLAWGGAEGDWSPRIPEGVRAVIARRLDRLPEGCRGALVPAAALGREFELAAVAALAEDMSEDEALDALEAAAAARVLEEVPGTAGRFAFSHSLIREALLEDLSAARRARLHARAVAALEGLYGADRDAHAAEILYHAARARPVLGAEPAARYALAAGEAALAARAYEEAAGLFRQAIDGLGPEAADADAAAAHFGLGRALLASRELHELGEAVASLQRAFDHHLAAGDPERAISVAAHPLPPHLMYEPTGVTRLVSRALELAPPESADAARLLAVYGWFAGINDADADGAQDAFDRAVAIAERLGEPALEVGALVNAQYVQMFHLRWDACAASGRRILELAPALGDRRSEAAARGWLARALVRSGQLDAARREAAAAQPLAEALGERYWRATAALHVAMTAAAAGDWDAARAATDAGLAARPSDPRNLGLRALVEHQTGELSAGDALLDRLAEIVASVPPPGPGAEHPYAAAYLALCDLAGGGDHLAAAERAAASVLGLARAPAQLTALAHLGGGLAAARRGDGEAAGAHAAALAPLAGTMVPLPPVSADRVLGLLALAAGRAGEAVERLRAAVALCARCGYRPEEAWAAADLADALAGGGGDEEEAARLRARALALATELGMTPLLGRLAVAT